METISIKKKKKKKIEELKVLFVASEVNPYIKSGGLGDVAGSLPPALKKLGMDIRIVFPKYFTVNKSKTGELKYLHSFDVKLDWRMPTANIFSIEAPIPTYLIENRHYFDRGHLYGFADDFERFAFFSKAAINLMSTIDFEADIIHFNDWQTALGCIYLKDVYGKFLFYENTKSIFTIHNLHYQGFFDVDVLPQIGLNYGYFTSDKMEYYNRVNFMKAGLTYADHITTVSPSYAHEIQTPQYGYGLDGLIRARNHQLTGILNGLDYNEYNPDIDQDLVTTYNVKTLDKKAINKAHLQDLLGLPRADVPIFAIISRLAEQKGLDLVARIMGELLQKNAQLVVLGTGEEHYEHMFSNTAYGHPDKISANIRFDAGFAHKIYAGSDFLLMPSLFEPCGLGQLMAMRYGTLPVVRKTGGLIDTVEHYNYNTRKGVGIMFEHYLDSGLLWAIDEAIHLYYQREHFRQAQTNAMKADFSWEKSAVEYAELYQKIANGT